MEYIYKTKNTCAREIKFDIEKNSLIVKTEKSNSIKNLL